MKDPDYKMYDTILPIFMKYMRAELEANYQKGDRDLPYGWLSNKNNKSWISELYYHVGKLQSALMTNDIKRIIENCADIANLAMMTLDVKIDLLAVDKANEVSKTKDTAVEYLKTQGLDPDKIAKEGLYRISKLSKNQDFTDKHLGNVFELLKKSQINRFINPMYGSLQAASIKYFLETGTVNGSFLEALNSMMDGLRSWAIINVKSESNFSNDREAERLNSCV